MKNSTFKIYTLGCKVNQYDSNHLASELEGAGFCSVEKNAQLAIINTCSVTTTAIGKDKRMINKAKAENPKAKIAVIGCWPAVYNLSAEAINADLIVVNRDWNNIINKLKAQSSNLKCAIQISTANNLSLTTRRNASVVGRSRYFIKIQDGCEQYCTYCVIPFARGKLQSRPSEEIINEVETVIKDGYEEIVLCGIHLGLYGKENENKDTKIHNLYALLKKLIKIENLGRIRLSSIELNEVDDKIIELIAGSDKLCRHLHIPLQAGSDKILKLMNRPYASGQFCEKVKKIRKYIPDIAITTDVIVGFPGETDAEFRQTAELIKKIGFSRLHVFPFSPHQKAPASKFSGQLDKITIKARSEKLKKLGARLEVAYKKKFKHKDLEVIIENEKNGKFIGKTQYYFDIELNSKRLPKKCGNRKFLIGKIIKLKY
jgi:threonylcarbamoyladenosine tRNA methylthiotransferase MtaB